MEDSTTRADGKLPRTTSAKQTPPTPPAKTTNAKAASTTTRRSAAAEQPASTARSRASKNAAAARTTQPPKRAQLNKKAQPNKKADAVAKGRPPKKSDVAHKTEPAEPAATRAKPVRIENTANNSSHAKAPARASAKTSVPLRKASPSRRATESMVGEQLALPETVIGDGGPSQATPVDGQRRAPTPRPASGPQAPPRPELVATTTPPAPPWARVVADPGHAPRHLARAAVRQLGPSAREWVVRTRGRYPDATADGLARLATRHFTRVARRQGAATGAAGLLGSLAATVVLVRTHAGLVLHIAAAYGVDPASEERADDLLLLLRLPGRTQPATMALADVGRLLGAFAVRRIAARVVPLGAVVAGAVQGGRSTGDVAARAVQHYRPNQRGHPSGG